MLIRSALGQRMNQQHSAAADVNRRQMLTQCGAGFGALALAGMLPTAAFGDDAVAVASRIQCHCSHMGSFCRTGKMAFRVTFFLPNRKKVDLICTAILV